MAHTQDSIWRNRDVFVRGRDEIVTFLTGKWERELDYVLRKGLGRSARTGSPCGSSTNDTTATTTGFAATARTVGV
jgi:hypothetical protein